MVVAVVVALAGAGAVLAALLLTESLGTGSAGGSVLRTPTGTLEVGALSVSTRHDPKDMIGMPPAGGHDAAGHSRVMVPVTLTNTSEQPVSYSPAQFRLVAGTTDVEPGVGTGGTALQTLRPQAAITLRLTFTAPTAERAHLRYSPAVGEPVVADLGPIAQQPAPAGPARQTPGSGEQSQQPSPAPAEDHSADDQTSHDQPGHDHPSASEDH